MSEQKAPLLKQEFEYEVYIKEAHYRAGLCRKETFDTLEEAQKYMSNQNVKCLLKPVRLSERGA